MSNARDIYVYDFDDTLVNTHEVLVQHRLLNRANELYINNDLGIMISKWLKPYDKIWDEVVRTSKIGNNIILSGRSRSQIEYWLNLNNKIKLFRDIIGLDSRRNVATLKRIQLEKLASQNRKIYFYDDKINNIEEAEQVPGVITFHVKHS